MPALAGTPSAELGHPAFQHPQRSREGVYSAEIDRFSHLAIYTAVHSLTVGGKDLWERFNNGDNLLFREDDFQDPANSEIFHTLWEVPDAACRSLVGRLALACEAPLDKTPLLEDVTNGRVPPLTPAERYAAESLLGSTATPVPAATLETNSPLLSPLVPEDPFQEVEPLGSLQASPIVEDPLEVAEESDDRSFLERQFGIESVDLSPMGILQLLDWPLKRIAGEENEIVHNFLRVLLTTSTALLLFFVVNSIVQWVTVETTDGQPTVTASTDEQIDDAASSSDSASSSKSPSATLDLPAKITNAIGMQFRLIPAGEFMMGSPEDDPNKFGYETPQHRVRITEPFYLGIHEVTQEQYERVMDENPSGLGEAMCPVEGVSWEDANDFCEKLSEMDTEHDYRLPTEAEWEYACRAGTITRYSCGDELDPGCAWFRDNSDGQTHPVGEKRPNAFGLYDMHGNVVEWCEDRYDSRYYGSSLLDDPTGPTTGSHRVTRSGSWDLKARDCRSADRNGLSPDFRYDFLGFRVALVPAESVTLPKDTMPPPELEPEPPPRPEPEISTSPPSPPNAVLELPEHTNAIGMKFKLIPAGEFLMGSPEDDPHKVSDETPQHRVRITEQFYLGVYEVTQKQYEEIMGKTPSSFEGAMRPVEGVSWEDATEFCRKLSEMDTDSDYRLPTEAEWEYACRAGISARYSCGDELNLGCEWFRDNSDMKTHPVGEKHPNAWGLYDMLGNVCEWCEDRYGEGLLRRFSGSRSYGTVNGLVPRAPRRQLDQLRVVLPIGASRQKGGRRVGSDTWAFAWP